MNTIGMLLFACYPEDTRPRRQAEALIEEGMSVDIICLQGDGEARKEIVNGVNVYRLPVKQKRGGKIRYLWEYTCFLVISFFLMSLMMMRKRYTLIHVHNMPDILVVSALVPRLFGSKIILDLHDPMPEVFMAKYSVGQRHPLICLIRLQEKISIWFADLVLVVNAACHDLYLSRGYPEKKFHVIMNSAQEAIFSTLHTGENQRREERTTKFVVMYHGTMVERNGIDVALEAVALVRSRIPNIVFRVYGKGDFVSEFKALILKHALEDTVEYHGHVSVEKIALFIQDADLGLIPNKPSIHWEHATPTRLFEYLHMRKPVIAPRIKGILDYFDEGSLYFYESGNAVDLADVIYHVYCNPAERQSILERGIEVCQSLSWRRQREQWINIVKTILEGEIPGSAYSQP